MDNSKIKIYLFLHMILMLYSISAILSKLAAGEKLFSFKFVIFYGIAILILCVYAIFWQQIIKKLPLTKAFANKAVTVIWGMIWGCVFFNEKLTIGRVAGSLLIVSGIILYAISD